MTSHFNNKFKMITAISFALVSMQTASAAYYNTLPAGVRALVYRQVVTTTINSAFDGARREQDYSYKLNINASSIQSATTALDSYLQPLKQLSPEAYNAFKLGEYAIDADAQVNVSGFGLAYGFTNKLTSYLAGSIYQARVNMRMVRLAGNNNNQVQNIVNSTLTTQADRDLAASFVQGATNSLPDISGGNIQSIMVNYLGYQPLGNWEGRGLGDLELGLIYRFTDYSDKGLAATFGVVLPTGREDDPDIIQDIGFGDGQTDLFVEGGGGVIIDDWSFNSYLRYTYQAPATKVMRIPESSEYQLGSAKDTFKEKLGDKIDFAIGPTYHLSNWLDLTGAYLYSRILEAKYSSQNAKANEILATNTEKESHIAKGEISASTVNLYKQGKFMAPVTLSISGQRVIDGQNTPKYTRFDLEFRLFF